MFNTITIKSSCYKKGLMFYTWISWERFAHLMSEMSNVAYGPFVGCSSFLHWTKNASCSPNITFMPSKTNTVCLLLLRDLFLSNFQVIKNDVVSMTFVCISNPWPLWISKTFEFLPELSDCVRLSMQIPKH